MNIFDFLSKFFKGVSKDQNKIPFLHEAIDLKTFPRTEVDLWMAQGGYHEISRNIIQAYKNFCITGKNEYDFRLVTIKEDAYSYGWHLDCNRMDYENEAYSFFAYSLCEKLKKQGYIIKLSEQKSTAKNEGVEMTIHYYLKPSLQLRFKNNNGPVSQLYGNISIEYKTINGDPYGFKFFAKAYSDSKYASPLDFSELHSILFDQ